MKMAKQKTVVILARKDANPEGELVELCRKMRLMSERDTDATLPQVLRVIYAREGVRGLYKGAAPSVLKAAPSAAVTFAAYDVLLRALTADVGC